MQNGIDGFLSMEVMLTLLVVYLAIGLTVLYFQLQKNAIASPVTIYQCARQESKRVDLETSSSEIRIESDDEGEETIPLGEGDMVSTKTWIRRWKGMQDWRFKKNGLDCLIVRVFVDGTKRD